MRALQPPFVVWFSCLQLRMLCSTYALQAQHAAPRVSPQHLHIKVNDKGRDERRVSVSCSCLCVLCHGSHATDLGSDYALARWGPTDWGPRIRARGSRATDLGSDYALARALETL